MAKYTLFTFVLAIVLALVACRGLEMLVKLGG